LAINYPHLVKGLILGCTSSGGKSVVMMSAECLDKFQANQGLTPREILEKDMDLYFSDQFIADNPELIEEFKGISLRHYQPPEAFLRQLDACLKHDTAGRVNRIKSPILIAHGDDDHLVPTANAYIMKELMPQAGLQMYEGGRHCFFIEHHARFNKAAIEFFKSVEGSSGY
jgi:pimeloyl-ACP methyl ester carboxylesterase